MITFQNIFTTKTFTVLCTVLTSAIFSQCQETIGGACGLTKCSTISNGLCVGGVCTCKDNFYDDGEHSNCLPSMPLGSMCDPQNRDINQCTANAHCSSRTCICNSDFYEHNKRCALRLDVGVDCNHSIQDIRQCVDNAECIHYGGQSKCTLKNENKCYIVVAVLSTLLIILSVIFIIFCVYALRNRNTRDRSVVPDDSVARTERQSPHKQKIRRRQQINKSNRNLPLRLKRRQRRISQRHPLPTMGIA